MTLKPDAFSMLGNTIRPKEEKWSPTRDSMLALYCDRGMFIGSMVGPLNKLPGVELNAADVRIRIEEKGLTRQPPPTIGSEVEPLPLPSGVVDVPKIEKGVPLPENTNTVAKYLAYPWKDMEVGDSFLIKNARGTAVGGMCNAAKRAFNRTFTSRKVKDGIRVWRTE